MATILKQQRLLGFVLVITGAILWGVGGVMSQYLFQKAHISVNWLVAVRLLISGVLLIMISALTNGKRTFTLWCSKHSVFQVIVYGILGMIAVQYTFMASINYGNATVATLLQYLGPVVIILYLVLRKVIPLQFKEIMAVVLALVGSFLLLTNGSISELSVPLPAIFWGLGSAFALAFYTLYPAKLLAQWGSVNIVGWAMLIGGITLSIFYPPWDVDTAGWTLFIYVLLFCAIIFGTMFAFWFFIASLQYLYPQESSLLGTIEPLTALVVSVIWLGDSFGPWQLLGVGMIIFMVVFLSIFKSK